MDRPRLWALLLAVLMPAVIGLIFVGKLMRTIDQNEQLIARQEAHIQANDRAIVTLERQVAVLTVRVNAASPAR